jgi:hypothetical protein
MDIITDEILMNGILPFIGEYHFRYIAGIDRQFYRAYTNLYPRKETYFLNGNMAALQDTSVKHIPKEIRLCLNEISKETMFHELHRDQVITLHKIAATNGNMELLEYLQDTYQYLFFGIRSVTIKKRARVDQSRSDIQWIQGRRLVCATAALHGQLDLLQLARCHYDMPWDVTTCSNAALHGHLHILKFAYHHKCPWDEQTRMNAEKYRGKHREEIKKWLEKRGCRIKPKPYSNYDDRYKDDRHEEYYNFMYLSDLGYY